MSDEARPAGTRLDQAAPWISTVARLVLGGVLLVAGGLKVIDPQSSVQAVKAYQLLPEALARIVGWGLPFAEIAVGLLLIVGLFTRLAAIVAGVLMLAFIAAVGSAAARGLSIDCGCFGGGGRGGSGPDGLYRRDPARRGTSAVGDLAGLAAAEPVRPRPLCRRTITSTSSRRTTSEYEAPVGRR